MMQKLLAIFLLTASTAAVATDLRGRVDGRNRYQAFPFPVGGTTVQLYVNPSPNVWQLVASAHTGPDGMYYFRGIRPGRYVMQVQGMNFPINVSPVQYQDLSPVIIAR